MTLLNEKDRSALEARIAQLRADSPRRWGRMTAAQMVCHVTDAFRGVLGERPGKAPVQPSLLGRTLVRVVALHLPMKWPHGLPTPAIVDQEREGSPPGEFAADVAALNASMQRFVRDLDNVASRPHVVFGSISRSEWAIWGYRHVDHHLTQFGV